MSPSQRERRRLRRHPMPKNEIAIYTDFDSQKGFGPQMLRDALAEADGGPVTVRMNSEGGNVIAGLACGNLLASYEGETTVIIDGMALSIASYVACRADRVLMAENSWLMFHNPENEARGDGKDLREAADLLDGMRDQLVSVYSAKSKKSKEEIIQLMAEETWYTGKEALAAGFVDEVTASLEMAAEFDASRFSNPPKIQKYKEPIMADPCVTLKELRSHFPHAEPQFVLSCLDKGYSLARAQAEHNEENAKALDDKTKELEKSKAEFEEFKKETDEEAEAKAKAAEEEKKDAEAKAKAEHDDEEYAAEAKGKNGVKAAASGKTRGGSGAQSGFLAGVTERVKLGATKAQAMSDAVFEDPEAHREFVKANQRRG